MYFPTLTRSPKIRFNLSVKDSVDSDVMYCMFLCFVSQQMEIDDDEDDEEEGMYFSAQDLLKLRESIVSLVRTLLRLLERISLRDKPQSADSCVQVCK